MPKNNKISRLIKLDKPLVIFDLESTGLSVNLDRIIEIAYLKIMPNGVTFKGDWLINPATNIPKEVSELNGLTDEDVKDQPIFREMAQELFEIFNGCYYGGFNVLNFDLPLLRRGVFRGGL